MSENCKNSKLCEILRAPCGCRVSTQFLVFSISTHVDITVMSTPKMFYFKVILCESDTLTSLLTKA